jgi:hypothetical protein
MYGCIRHRFDILLMERALAEEGGDAVDYEIPWSDVVKHTGEWGFCNHNCAESGNLIWLHYYPEGSLTYCPTCHHYGVLVRIWQ